MRVLIAGGGTAGHVNPGLALAERLQGDAVVFLGTEDGAEARLVPEAGYELLTVDVAGYDRARPSALPSVAWRALRAWRASRKILRDVRPDVVVGMGGYVSLPVCLAARSLKVPVVLHEQNIVLGLANKVCKHVAKTIAVSFDDTLQQVGKRGVHTGNPIARDIAELDRDEARAAGLVAFDLSNERVTLLIFGGSLGARRINEAAVGLPSVWAGRTDVQIVHVYGAGNEEVLESLGDTTPGHPVYRAMAYVDNMAEAYAVADLVVCRGGATTVAELCAVGLPAVIVPYPHHRDMQQDKHARVLERAGAALVLPDAETTTQKIAEMVDPLVTESGSRAKMGVAAKQLGRPEAAVTLASLVRAAAG